MFIAGDKNNSCPHFFYIIMQKSILFGSYRNGGNLEHFNVFATNGSGKVIATLYAYLDHKNNIMWISNINVLKDYRDMGYGKALIQKILNFCSREIRTYRLFQDEYNLEVRMSIADNNEVCKHLAERFHFEPEERSQFGVTVYINRNVEDFWYNIKGFKSRDNKDGLLTYRDDMIYCTYIDKLLFSASKSFCKIEDDNNQLCDVLYLYDFYDLRRLYRDETWPEEFSEDIYTSSLERLINYCEIIAKEHSCKMVYIPTGTSKKIGNVLLKDILYPLGYKYKNYFHGFIKEIKYGIQTLHARGCHVEVTTLVVPGKNDREEDMDAVAAFIASVSPEIPLHVTRFYPRFQMMDTPTTPAETIQRLAAVARRHLKHVL